MRFRRDLSRLYLVCSVLYRSVDPLSLWFLFSQLIVYAKTQTQNLVDRDLITYFLYPVFWTTLHQTTMAEIHDQFDTILILDFGSQVR